MCGTNAIIIIVCANDRHKGNNAFGKAASGRNATTSKVRRWSDDNDNDEKRRQRGHDGIDADSDDTGVDIASIIVHNRIREVERTTILQTIHSVGRECKTRNATGGKIGAGTIVFAPSFVDTAPIPKTKEVATSACVGYSRYDSYRNDPINNNTNSSNNASRRDKSSNSNNYLNTTVFIDDWS